MSFNPRNLYEPSNYRTVKDILRVETYAGHDILDIRMVGADKTFKFASIHHVFGCLRQELAEQGHPGFLIKNSARYAISDDQLKIPSLYNPADGTFIFDPLLPYRNPIINLYKGDVIRLTHVEAQLHYFAPGVL